jgi:predicted PurR-regulated permease PerM
MRHPQSATDPPAERAPSANADPSSYVTRVVVAVAIAALAFLAWRLLDVFVLAFGGVLVAVALRTISNPLHRATGLSERLALGAVVVGLAAIVVLGVWLIGDRAATQLQELRQVLPKGIDAITQWLSSHAPGRTLLELLANAKQHNSAWSQVAGLATMTLGAVSSALLVIVVGIYLAADPGLYRRGVLRLFPLDQRARLDNALHVAGEGLSRWLLGQGVSMVAIGTLTAIGLWLLGVPLALSMGVIAGVLAFVPFFGAVASGVLIVLLAFTQGPQLALYAAVLCLAIQQFEELVLLPFVHRWAVRLPPVLGLLAAVIFGILFGIVGVLFATPLMVLMMILVQRLYVHGVLEPPKPEDVRLGASVRPPR